MYNLELSGRDEVLRRHYLLGGVPRRVLGELERLREKHGGKYVPGARPPNSITLMPVNGGRDVIAAVDTYTV